MLLLGSTGGLGRVIAQLFRQREWSVRTPTRDELDLTNPTLTIRFTRGWSRSYPDGVIVYAAGLTSIDECARQPVVSQLLNEITPSDIAASRYRHPERPLPRFVFFSTDQVFGPGPSACYRHHPDDDPLSSRWLAVNTYGGHKALAETKIRLYPQTTIIRTTWLYGGKSSWIDQVIDQAQANKPVTASAEYRGLPTRVQDLAAGLWGVLQLPEPHPVYNLVAEGEPVNRVELAQFIGQLLDRPITISPQTLAELGQLWVEPRTLGSALKNFDEPRLPNWRDSLTDYVLHRQLVAA